MQASRLGGVGDQWRLGLLGVVVCLAVALLLVVSIEMGASGAAAHTGNESGTETDIENDVEVDDFVDPGPVEQLVALPGSCPSGAPIEPGTAVDCFFEILPYVDPTVFRFADVVFDGTSRPCHVEAGIGGWDRLACPGLLRDHYEEGAASVDLRVEYRVAEAAATATLTWGIDAGISIFGDGEGESVVFEGRPLRFYSYTYESVDGLFLNFRERNGAEIVGTVQIEAAELFESASGSVAPDLPAGRYRMWPCVGATADTCLELPGGRPFQVIDGEPLELIEGHNRVLADRINVLFVSSGLERAFEGQPQLHLPELATTLLTIDGPYGVDFNDEPIHDNTQASRLLWGPMAIEPLASNLDRFNFWYLSDEIADEVGLLFGGSDVGGDAGFDLPNLQITALYNDGFDFTSDARRTSFESIEPADVPVRGQIRFGDARVWIPQFTPLIGATTLAHEWGHGIFGLRDEYYGFDDRAIEAGFPNCAPDLVTAELWWGSVVGEADPFVETVLEAQEEMLANPEYFNVDLSEQTTIEITAGGCYSDAGSTEVYRPSVDSIMNSEVPVFGAVNRERVQEVLDRFNGRGPMSSLEDLALDCEGLDGFVVCSGELLSHLEKPLSIVAINSSPCEFGTPRPGVDGEFTPVPVTCTTTGEPTDPVELTFKGERIALDVVDVNPPPTPVDLAPSRVAADSERDDAATVGNGRTVAVGVLLAVAAGALGFVERRRRSRE